MSNTPIYTFNQHKATLRSLLKEPLPKLRRELKEFDLTLLEPAGCDPLLKRMIEARPAITWVFVVILMLLSLTPSLAAWIEGNFINPELDLDLIHDYLHLSWIPLGIPLMFMLLSSYFRLLPKVILRICLNDVVALNNANYSEFVTFANKLYNSKKLFFIPLAVGALFAGINALFFQILFDGNTWQANEQSAWYGTVAGCLDKIFVGVLIFFVATISLRLWTTFKILRKFFEYPTNIQPLHPDNCGGLAPLGTLSISLNIGVFFFGFVLIAVYYVMMSNYSAGSGAELATVILPIVIGTVMYPLLSTIVVFLPLYSTHRIMKEARYRFLDDLSMQHSKLVRKIQTAVSNGNLTEEDDYQQMAMLQELHETARKMPVMPFDFRTVTTFATSIIAPFILSQFDKILGLFTRLFQ